MTYFMRTFMSLGKPTPWLACCECGGGPLERVAGPDGDRLVCPDCGDDLARRAA